MIIDGNPLRYQNTFSSFIYTHILYRKLLMRVSVCSIGLFTCPLESSDVDESHCLCFTTPTHVYILCKWYKDAKSCQFKLKQIHCVSYHRCYVVLHLHFLLVAGCVKCYLLSHRHESNGQPHKTRAQALACNLVGQRYKKEKNSPLHVPKTVTLWLLLIWGHFQH